MGSTGTKYFPVHIDYNTKIRIKEMNTNQKPVTPVEKEGLSDAVCVMRNRWGV